MAWRSSFAVKKDDKDKSLRLYEKNGQRRRSSLGARIDEWLQKNQRRQVIELAGFKAGMHVLDAGAGLGFLVKAAKKAGARVVAVDIVPALVNDLACEADTALIGDVETLHIDGKFDRVLIIGVLDFVVDPKKVLSRLASLVASGGELIVLVPTSTFFGHLYRLEKHFKGVKVNLYNPDWCAEVCREQGLELVSTSHPWPSNALMSFRRPQQQAAPDHAQADRSATANAF